MCVAAMGQMGQTYLIDRVIDVSPVWDQTDKKYNRDLKAKRRYGIGQKYFILYCNSLLLFQYLLQVLK